MLAPRPTPKLEDHLLSAVRDFLFNIFAATFHIGGDPGADGRIMLRWIFGKWDMGVWTGSRGLRIGTGGGQL